MISKYIFIQSKQICIPKKKRFYYITFFHFMRLKYFLYYMSFSFDTFIVPISGLLFLFASQNFTFTM